MYSALSVETCIFQPGMPQSGSCKPREKPEMPLARVSPERLTKLQKPHATLCAFVFVLTFNFPSNFFANFEGLVLGCIGGDFRKQVLVGKLLTRSITIKCSFTFPISKYQHFSFRKCKFANINVSLVQSCLQSDVRPFLGPPRVPPTQP